MFLTSLIGKRLSRVGSVGRRRTPVRQRRFRPSVRALEERAVPSTLHVTNTLDDGSPGSFLAAMNAAHGGDTIVFDANLAGQTIDFGTRFGSISLGGGSLTIQGPATPVTFNGGLQGYEAGPWLGIDHITSLDISYVNFEDFVTDPSAGGFGAGALAVHGTGATTLALDHCTFSGNVANGGYGGALSTYANVVATLTSCTFTNDQAVSIPAFGPGPGGAIAMLNSSLASMTLDNCTFTGNQAPGSSGGAVYSDGGSVTVNSTAPGNSVFSSNSADYGGAIYSTGGNVNIDQATLTANVALHGGGGVWVDPASLTVTSSTITGNTAPVGADIDNVGGTVAITTSVIGTVANSGGSVTAIASTVGSISNSGGGTSVDTAAVLASLTAQVSSLAQAGTLSTDQAAGLSSKLQAAQKSIAGGKYGPAVNQLNAFENQVNAFEKSHTLTTTLGQPLLDGANQIIAGLNSTGARLVTDGGSPSSTGDTQPVSSAGDLVTGTVGVYLDNADGTPVPTDEQARFDDALNALDATFGAYGVNLVDLGIAGAADAVLQVQIAATSPAGSATDGVLGCTVAGQITLLTGWTWFTGADPTTIGANQYDFETIVMHELGHSIGLGHSGDTGSVMYPYLAAGQARRGLTTADLSVLEQPSGTPEPLLAAWAAPAAPAPPPPGAALTTPGGAAVQGTSGGVTGMHRTDDLVRDLVFAVVDGDRSRGAGWGSGPATLPAVGAHELALNSLPPGPTSAIPNAVRAGAGGLGVTDMASQQGPPEVEDPWSAASELAGLDRCFAAWPPGADGAGRRGGTPPGWLRSAGPAGLDRAVGAVTVMAADPVSVALAGPDRTGQTAETVGPAGVGVVPHGADVWLAGLAAAVVGAWAPTVGDRVTVEEDDKEGQRRRRKTR
jgi:predicted outer membrane repeat protein